MLYSRHYAVTTLIKLPLLPLQRLRSNLALPAEVAQQPLQAKAAHTLLTEVAAATS